MLVSFRNWYRRLLWFHATRFIAIILIFYGVAIEDDPGNRGTCITAAIGLLAAEPVGRREKATPSGKKDDKQQGGGNGTG